MRNRLLPVAASALLLCSTILTAQVAPAANQDRQVESVPDYLLNALELRSGTLQTLDLPVDGIPEFEVSVVLGSTRHKLQLHIHDMRSSSYELQVYDAAGLHEAPSGLVTTYRGLVDGDPGSFVAGTLSNDQLEAVIVLSDDSTWGIHPTHRLDQNFSRKSHLIYKSTDLLGKNVLCGVTGLAPAAPALVPEAISPPKIAEIALDADFTFFARNGQSVANTEANIMTVINVVDAIYSRDVGIQYTITTIIVRTVQVYQQTSPGNILNEFTQRWTSFHRLVPRDIAHLFFDKNIHSGVIGVAFLSTICNRFRGYGVSATNFSNSLARRAGLTAHEIGHNWSAQHCNANPADCRIMCSGLGGCSGDISKFGTASRTSITRLKDNLSCLGSPGAVLGSITPTTVTSFQPGEITLSGANLNSVTSINVAGQVLTNFVATNDNTIRFTPTQPLPITFLNQVSVSSAAGTSNFLFLNVVGNHPSVLEAQTVVSSLDPISLQAHTDNAWLVLLFASPSDLPSLFPGIVNLAIGNDFTQLISVQSVTAGADGSHNFSLNLPTGFPLPAVLNWQLVTLSGLSSGFPLEVSNAVNMTIS